MQMLLRSVSCAVSGHEQHWNQSRKRASEAKAAGVTRAVRHRRRSEGNIFQKTSLVEFRTLLLLLLLLLSFLCSYKSLMTSSGHDRPLCSCCFPFIGLTDVYISHPRSKKAGKEPPIKLQAFSRPPRVSTPNQVPNTGVLIC